VIKLDDPGTWPKHEDLVYRGRWNRLYQLVIAHAFHRGHESLCGMLHLEAANIPQSLGRLCMRCHRRLHEEGYA